MQIISVSQLDSKHLDAVAHLLNTCKKMDGASIPTYPHLLETLRVQSPTLLCYERDILIGLLAVFYFYEDAVEISLLVHPNFRKQGIAKTLWDIMKTGITQAHYPIKAFIVSSPTSINQSWLSKKDFIFEHTEFDMACTPHKALSLKQDTTPTFQIRTANKNDINALCKIDSLCFNAKRPSPVLRMEKLLATKNLFVFVLVYQKQCIGQVHLVFEHHQEVRLTDLAVLPNMQQKGFGQALLSYAMNTAYSKKQKKISLCVAAKNQRALHLYQNIGFKIYIAIDYYKKRFSLDRF